MKSLSFKVDQSEIGSTPPSPISVCLSPSVCVYLPLSLPCDSFDRAGVKIQLLICLSFVPIVSGQNGTSSSIQTKCTTSLRMYTNTSDSKLSAA